STQLSKDEIEKLKQEASMHAEEDKRKKELIEARNHGEQAAYLAEKSLNEWNDKIDATLKEGLETKIKELRDALQKEDREQIVAKTEELSVELQKIGQSMYTDKKSDEAPGEPEKSDEDKSS